MAWVTRLGPSMEQVDYRLECGAGCEAVITPDPEAAEQVQDRQVGYRLDGADRPLEWAGNGLREVGIEPGTVLGEDAKDAARAIMSGRDPVTGTVLVPPKMAVDPRGKLPAAPLLNAIGNGRAETIAAADKAAGLRLARVTRGVAKEGEAHKIPVRDAARIARAAGIELDSIYGKEKVKEVSRFAGRTVRTGNRGYDLTLDLPKSVSVLWALADPATAARIEAAFTASVRETVTVVERWAGYGLAGHHGDGERARRVESSGLLGWVMWHHTARPVAGQVPDPHLHAHVVIANMTRCEDEKWRTVAAGGRDLHRHAHAADAFLKARLRHELAAIGVRFDRDPVTAAWEIRGIDRDLRETFSKRHGQVHAVLERLGIRPADATCGQQKTAATVSREAKQPGPASDLRADWRAQARGYPDVTAALTRPTPAAAMPAPAQVAVQIFAPGTGLMAHRKTVSRADVLAAVIDACPGGIPGLAAVETLTDAVLTDGLGAVPLPSGPPQLTNTARYTTSEVIAAEQQALAIARAGYGAGLAQVPARTAALAIAAAETAAGITLTSEQRAVVERLTGAGHAVDTVTGVPGAGKTLLLTAARTAWQAEGYVVAGAAVAAVAVQNLHAGSGISSATIASWLMRIQDGPGLAGVDVLVIDEAAMCDDRDLAALLAAARQAGTKTVAAGDPQQLQAVGIGGTFAAIHRQIGGLTLTENQRQDDPLERRALDTWRAGNHPQALQTWAEGQHIHAGHDRDDTLAALLTHWAHARQHLAGNPHEELAGLLVLAGTNADVDAINTAARAIRRAAGEITSPGQDYRLAGGGTLTIAAGDHVRIRINDYRTATGHGTDVINGYRGIALDTDPARGVLAQWRRPGPDGPVTETGWLSPAYIATGGLSHGTAMTVASAQGSTAGLTLIYGLGLDPHQLYTAMSRDREAAHLYLPRALLEDDTDQAIHGEPATPAEHLNRTIAAYARTLTEDHADRLVLAELGRIPEPLAHPEPDPDWHARTWGQHTRDELERLLGRYLDAVHRLHDWDQRTAAERVYALAGHGPAATALHHQLARLQAAAAAETQLGAARGELAQARADIGTATHAIADASRQLDRSRIALALDGTTRGAQRAAHQAGYDSLRDAQQREHAATAAIPALQRAAAEPYQPLVTGQRWDDGLASSSRDLAQLTATWDTQLRQAISRDVSTARHDAADPKDSAITRRLHVTTPAEARKVAIEITAEIRLRDHIDPAHDIRDDLTRLDDRQPARRHHAPLIYTDPLIYPDPHIQPEPGGPTFTP
jgi:conjugative relaxase-like TrwC/TraI family protein